MYKNKYCNRELRKFFLYTYPYRYYNISLEYLKKMSFHIIIYYHISNISSRYYDIISRDIIIIDYLIPLRYNNI